MVSESRNGTANRDVIADFKHLVDKIDLASIDASTKASSNQAFKFIGTAGFHKVAGEVRYFQGTSHTYIAADVNGDGATDLQIELLGKVRLTKTDFIL